jgi:hypothetical protein
MTGTTGTTWTIEAHHIPADETAAGRLITQIRALRSRILYDRGRRPAFRADGAGADGADAQPQDFGSWHFLARREAEGPVLGYVRLATPAIGDLYQSREFLGTRDYEALLQDEGLSAGCVFEHSRLVVEHRARKLGLGVRLNAAAIGAAHALGARAMTGTSGTADGQDLFHGRFGFEPVPGTRRYVERYTEEVVLLIHRADQGAGEYGDLVAEYQEWFSESVLRADRRAVPVPDFEPTQGSVPRQSGRRRVGAGGAPPPALAALAGASGASGASGAAGPSGRPTPGDSTRWRPLLLAPAAAGSRAALAALLASGAVREVCDRIDDQLTELVLAREPGRREEPGFVEEAKLDQLAGLAPWEYGTWAWYPWSGRLVHVLPREEFRLVRTDRNRGKIERPEQRRLLSRRIGVIGLSVGGSAALTLAQEGIGGTFRLADFDTLSLSNLNRLRAGVHDLGLNKAVLTARQLAEIDPYLDVRVWSGGLTEENLAAYFEEPLDLLVEECDTPWVKVAARERARALGVPVLMDCNDRGLLDVERFDREPHRPLLHGRLGGLTSADVRDLGPRERVELIIAMVDAERISPELAASIPELGRTLSSWPQLASGVALGGALVGEAARRILLGRPCDSGRFYVDLAQLLAPERDTVGGLCEPELAV